jgi:NAD(P)-dependent dehydrogenase (short-subunit alcohol dehydrogenase family)
MAGYALITGATSGIGEELCLTLSCTTKLILCGRSDSKLGLLKERCTYPEIHYTFCADLASERQSVYEKLSDFILTNNIPVESFIHCAGMTRIMPVRNFSPDFVDEIYNVNLFSAIELLRALLKRCNRSNLKNVIFISGLWSIRADVGNSIYASAKGAINSLVLTLAKELAPSVRVNSVVPGAVITRMTREKLNNDEYKKNLENDYPLGLGKPSDITSLIEFLLSDKASWITGQNIVIDGGRSLK